jgi:hypothetical protein
MENPTLGAFCVLEVLVLKSRRLGMSSENKIKSLALRLPIGIVERLHLESLRIGKPMVSIVATTLDDRLPKNLKIVVGKDDNRRRA